MPRSAVVKDFIVGVKRQRSYSLPSDQIASGFRTSPSKYTLTLPAPSTPYMPRKNVSIRRRYPYGRRHYRRLARPMSRAGLYGSYVPTVPIKRVSSSGRRFPLYLRPSRTAVEAHYHFVNFAVSSVRSDNPSFHCLNDNILAGDSIAQRTGNSINMRQLNLNITAELPDSGSTHAGNTVRYMLVFQKQTYGAQPGITDLLVASSTANYYNAHQNPSFRDKYAILFDDTLDLGGAYRSTDWDPTSNSRKQKRYSLDLGKRIARWASATSHDYSNMTYGILWLIIMNSGWTSTDYLTDPTSRGPTYAVDAQLVFEP